MSKKPEFKQYNQIPDWKPDDKFELTGEQFLVLRNFFSIFTSPINVMEDVFGKHLNNGTIKIKYEDAEGNEVSREEVQKNYEEFRKYLESKNKEEIPAE